MNLISVVLLFGRSLFLTRWLPVADFGIYTWVSTIIALSLLLADFGLGEALLHRTTETEQEEPATATHFTLKLLFTAVWTMIMLIGTFLLTSGVMQTAFVVLILARGLLVMCDTPRMLLVRRVIHRRLALLQLFTAVGTTTIGLALAYTGYGLWALLATDIMTALLSILLLYVWRPVWRPRLTWNSARNRYFLQFGQKSFGANLLGNALDKVDDIWIGIFLGNQALGYYSRAYTFATYPRKLLALPINNVVRGTYAESKNAPAQLSFAFQQTNGLLIRSGFLVAGGLVLVAPTFIDLFLGERWLPMLPVLQLMLIFTLLDPLKGNIGSLFTAVGQPQIVVRTRLGQLVLLIIGMFLLGLPFGILGVAVAVNLMLIAGLAILFWQARSFVQFSLRQLFLVPITGLLLACTLVLSIQYQFPLPSSSLFFSFILLLAEFGLFVIVYAAWLWLWERKQLLDLWYLIKQRSQKIDHDPVK